MDVIWRKKKSVLPSSLPLEVEKSHQISETKTQDLAGTKAAKLKQLEPEEGK